MNAPTALPDFLDELRRRVSGELRTDRYSRLLYSTDASIYQVMPHGVLIPKNVEDVHAAVETAARFGIPIVPRTGGSSLAGQAVNAALVIDMSRHLDQVLEVNPEEHWVRVQPGVVLDQLNEHLRPHHLKFGPDPASSNRAGMGGIVSNNSTGAHSILYGMTADHVLESRGFLSDGRPFHFAPCSPEMLAQREKQSGLEGEIYRSIRRLVSANAAVIRSGTPRHWRRCGGYNLDRLIPEGGNFRVAPDSRFNLAKLVCGAEGTLTVMSEIKLNLVPTPRHQVLGLVHFADLRSALKAVPFLLETGPAAIELLDNMGLTLCRDVPEYARLLQTFSEGNPFCMLITEYYGDSEAEARDKLEKLKRRLLRQKIPAQLVEATSPQVQENVWKVRKAGLGLLMSIKGDFKPIAFIEDAAVPPEHLAEYILRIEKFCHELGTRVAYYAHASGGCLHVRPLINTKIATDIAKLPQIASFSAGLVGQYHGALSSEHGDGRLRTWLNERFFGKELYELYREVKHIFDPQNILNPGNIVDGQQMTANLRYGAGYQSAALPQHLNFSSEGGFDRAVEMCNGAAVCRKLGGGSMCPSFMVTREEEHSTRGRANALRGVLSGRLPLSEFTSRRMYEVMELCVECKACKAECPSSVDMARIKFEFLSHYHRAHGIPVRDRLLANVAGLNRAVSGPLAPLFNRVTGAAVTRLLLESFLGLSRRRKLPSVAAVSFLKWFERQRAGKSPGGRPLVALFNDTFTTYNEPHIAVAAVEVMEAAGFEVVLPGHRCCGRPLISKGLVDQARAAARETAAHLLPLVQEGIPIVGLEPGCLLALRDEYLYLLKDAEAAACVARHSFTFEEFFFDLAGREEGNHLPFKKLGKNVLLHGHCHQKALVGTAPARRVLELAGCEVQEVDSGCCGMAGAFGYEKEHFHISMAMAERRLLPEVRRQNPATLIVAAGTSCRHQIAAGSGRRAYHPAEVLRMALP